MIEVGYERDSLNPGLTRTTIRWWVYVDIDGGRNQAARKGVIDRGYRFARGGRASSDTEAIRAIEYAKEEARQEWAWWKTQPSHALGPGGELIPLDELIDHLDKIPYPQELERSAG